MRMDYCQFVLLHEGPSDAGLVSVLETLLAEAGFDEVYGEAHLKTGSVEDTLVSMAEDLQCFHFVFVHRDADRAGRDARVAEIVRSAANITWPEDDEPRVVPIVPVTMTEAWLLLDETAIRTVCGNPRGTEALNLPKPREIEGIADPKTLLFDVLRKAAPRRGRRRITDREVGSWRSRLLERLDVHGPVQELSAWKALEQDIAEAWKAYQSVRGPV